jgi:hypothetical protein
MVAGAVSVFRQFIFKQEDMRVFNIFLFRFTLPMSVILGLGIKTDIYDPDVWRFVGAFLMMRAIMLLACVVVVGGLQRGTLGDVTVNWLSTTWISTGEERLGAMLCPLAKAGHHSAWGAIALLPPLGHLGHLATCLPNLLLRSSANSCPASPLAPCGSRPGCAAA